MLVDINHEQLPLALNLNEVYQFDNFYFTNAEIKHTLENFDIPFVYLWGSHASGKSHLLMAVVENSQQRAHYLPLAYLVAHSSPNILASFDALDLLCIDELDAVADLPDWQEALFHCFNRLQHSGCQLLVAAQHAPVELGLLLADLKSRMATGLTYQLESLNDEDKQRALALQAQARGLDLPSDVALHLLRHQSRDMVILMQILQSLDKASMATQRRLTIPFVRKVLHG